MRRKTCRDSDCPLLKRTVTEVPYHGNKQAKVVLCGESPGPEELRMGVPFCTKGRSGKKVRKIVYDVGLSWDEILVINSARCMIDKKRLSAKEITRILACCRSKVKRILDFTEPKCIIAAGDFAMRQILRKSGITKSRGKWVWSKEFGCWVLPTFHPAYILRNPSLEQKLYEDLRAVKRFVDNDYEPVQDTVDFEWEIVDSLEEFVSQATVVSVDTEGQGLDWTDPNYLMISYSISTDANNGVCVRLLNECKESEADYMFIQKRAPAGKKKKVDTPVYVKKCEGFLEKLWELDTLLRSPAVKKRMMNGNFDLHVINTVFERELGQPAVWNNYVMDVQAAAHVIDENLYKMASLRDIQMSFCERQEDYNLEFDKTYDKADMIAVPVESCSRYACMDTAVTWEGGESLKRVFGKNGHHKMAVYFSKFVMPTLQKSIYTMEKNGVHFDADAMPKVQRKVDAMMVDAEKSALKKIKKAVKDKHEPLGLRLTRKDLVRDALFSEDGFGLEAKNFTKGGAPQVGKEIRKNLLEGKLSKTARTFLEKYNRYSDMHTLSTRYLTGLKKHVKHDGRIHSSLSLTTAVTGRLASSSPNVMNFPKRGDSAHFIRRLISAAPGYKLLAADQSQSELRWAAEVSGDPEMMKVFLQNKDIHMETAKSLSRVDWNKISEDEQNKLRGHAKAVNFGLLYLMSVWGFIKYAKREYGIILSQEEAERWVRIFFNKYSGLVDYHKKTIQFCLRNGFVESPLGRRRRLPEIWSKDAYIRGEAERMAVNHPIQNPSSDVVLLICNSIQDKDIDPDEFRPVLFIHDELIYEVKDDARLVDEYARLLQHEMVNPPLEEVLGYKMRVPLASDVKEGYNLAEMSKMSL